MQAIQPDTSYHIFNHANGFENIFRIEGNFNYFLEKYWSYISPIAETNAYCLMPNHFHLELRIHKRETISDKTHFLNEIVYTHRNPIHHGFCENMKTGSIVLTTRLLKGSVIRQRSVNC